MTDNIARTIAALREYATDKGIPWKMATVSDADILALCDAAEAGLRSPPREPTLRMMEAVTDAADDPRINNTMTLEEWVRAMRAQINQAPRGETITFDALVAHGLSACRAEGREHNIINGLPWSFDFYGIAVTHENDDCYILSTHAGTVRVNRDKSQINDGEPRIGTQERRDWQDRRNREANARLDAINEGGQDAVAENGGRMRQQPEPVPPSPDAPDRHLTRDEQKMLSAALRKSALTVSAASAPDDRMGTHWETCGTDGGPRHWYCAQLLIAALRADAERYRWLRPRLYSIDFSYGNERASVIVFEAPSGQPLGPGLALDAAIDKARGG